MHTRRFTNPALSEFILRYDVFRFIFGHNVSPPAKYHTPLPEQSLAFYPRDPQRFSYADSTDIITYPRSIVNGVYNGPLYRYGGHDFLAIRMVVLIVLIVARG